MTSSKLSFEHVFVKGTASRTLLLLHGTGGNENDLLDVGRALDPAANLLSPRGKVLEHGMPRFFRRLAEGVFDEADLRRRAAELAGFIAAAATEYGFDADNVTAVGFSNGANIAAAVLLLHPGTLRAAALWRPMFPLEPSSPPNLTGKRVLMINGQNDPIVPAESRQRLLTALTQYGAEVTPIMLTGGHNLTQRDFAETQRWLAD